MLEEIRDHDPEPTPEELAWIGTETVTMLARALVLAGVAIALGFGASVAFETLELPAGVALASPR